MTCAAKRFCSSLSMLALFLSVSANLSVAQHTTSFSAVRGSFTPTTDAVTGDFSSANMEVDVVLAPRNESTLADLLVDRYNPQSKNYQHWLAQGEFYARFAPTAQQIKAVTDYLSKGGLEVEPSSSPFLIRVSGSSSMIENIFKTNIRTYRNRKGIDYFSNDSEIQMPASVASQVRGVIGLSNTVRFQSMRSRPVKQTAPPAPTPSCETPYPTEEQLANAIFGISGYAFGYGGGPGCNGLTPAQDNAIYGAPNLGSFGKGTGIDLAVFELSAYQQSDIQTWAKYFYGASYKAPLVDITVDGGPLSPICPVGDTCPAFANGYSGDIEVDADIEMQLAISPNARHVLVYNAPNDYTGQTSLDEFTKIANDDTADVVSSSWAVCENDAGAAYAQAENVIFEQMALQGQSVFGAAGDTGAFSCIRSDGTTIANVLDPPSQPWVTSVGGTSLETFNPNANPNPTYPNGIETVWNVLNLCNAGSGSDGLTGFDWCAEEGAGGGGNSEFWGRPIYQFGPGVNNPNSTVGNGTTQCSLAAKGKPCREVPDVSINADENTPYAEYCTGNSNTPFSVCGEFSQYQTPAGWFGIGGTSLSSPFWSAIIANHDSLYRTRIGNANPLLYLLFNVDANGYFHDITGKGQTVNNNGIFPTTPGYDLATGIGTPKMGAIITLIP
jgi:subtilase family serine protease